MAKQARSKVTSSAPIESPPHPCAFVLTFQPFPRHRMTRPGFLSRSLGRRPASRWPKKENKSCGCGLSPLEFEFLIFGTQRLASMAFLALPLHAIIPPQECQFVSGVNAETLAKPAATIIAGHISFVLCEDEPVLVPQR